MISTVTLVKEGIKFEMEHGLTKIFDTTGKNVINVTKNNLSLYCLVAISSQGVVNTIEKTCSILIMLTIYFQ